MGIERDSAWYDEYLWNGKEKMLYRHKSGLYISAYNLFSGNNIIDLGCGSGRLAKVLQVNKFNGKYLGVDFSKNAIEYCRKTYPYEFVLGSVFDVSMDEYDTVVSLEVLEHINNDTDLLRNIPKGKTFIFSVPSFDNPSHVRHFKNMNEVKDRYRDLLTFERDIVIDRIFLFRTQRS